MSEEREEILDEGTPPKLRRSRRSRDEGRWNGAALLPYVWDGLVLLLLATAVAIFFLDPRWRLIGGMVLTVGLIGGLWRLHYRILHHTGWWLTVCPKCQAKDLHRRRRSWRHRLLGWVGIPVRPYICNACGWRGSRIDPARI